MARAAKTSFLLHIANGFTTRGWAQAARRQAARRQAPRQTSPLQRPNRSSDLLEGAAEADELGEVEGLAAEAGIDAGALEQLREPGDDGGPLRASSGEVGFAGVRERLAAIRERLGLDYAIIGVGGVVAPEDYRAYRAAGADAVMSATGAMWDAELARKIKADD